jgi:hypothetical protein
MSVSPITLVFLENPSRGLAGGGEIFAGQVHLKVNRSYSSDSGLLIEPAISGTTMLQRLSLARHVMLSGLISKRCQRSNSRNEMLRRRSVKLPCNWCFVTRWPPFHECDMSDFRS